MPYGDGVTFWALAEIVKAEAGILESDRPTQATDKLREVIARVSRDPAEAQWLERHLRPLVGLAEVSQAGPSEAFAAWRRFLEALAEERPVVLVCEDLHWADDVFLDFLDELVDRVAGVPLLVLATSRPELLQRRPTWGGGKPNALTISLPPLSEDDIERMVQAMPEQPTLEAGTRRELVSRSGGNPLYAEQYARALLERGELDQLPATVHGIIAARLDALPEQEKRLLQNAAVIGKVFWLGSVADVDTGARWQVEELLRALERKEFVQRSRTSSVGAETEWAFRHGLIRDVAYGQIPRAARAVKHQRAAAWIESLGRPEDQAEMLAHHYLQALELAEAAGVDTTELGESARHALRDAGERAAALYAVQAAERFFDAALRLWPAADPQRARLLFRRAAPVLALAVADNDLLAEARDALLAAGDLEGAADATTTLSRSYWTRGQRELAIQYSDQAISLVTHAPASRAGVRALSNKAIRTTLGGDSLRGAELAAQACGLAEEIGWDEGLSDALANRGLALDNLGDPRGLQDFLRAIDLATSAGALGTLSRLQNNLSARYVLLGDLRASAAARSEAMRVAEQMGVPEDLRWHRGIISREHYHLGQWNEGLRRCDEFLAEVEAGSPHYQTSQNYCLRAAMRLGYGDVDGALSDAAHAYDIAAAFEDPQVRHYVLPLCAEVFVGAGQPERSGHLVEEMLAVLRAGAEMQFAVVGLPALFSTALRLGRASELGDALAGIPVSPWTQACVAYAQADAAAAADILQAIGTVPDEAQARLRAAEHLLADGKPHEAQVHVHRAIELYTAAGAAHYVAEAQRLLAASG